LIFRNKYAFKRNHKEKCLGYNYPVNDVVSDSFAFSVIDYNTQLNKQKPNET